MSFGMTIRGSIDVRSAWASSGAAWPDHLRQTSTQRMTLSMDRLRTAARMLFVLIIAISAIMPNCARAMPMQSVAVMTNAMMSNGCQGHGCSDHQSGNPMKAKGTGCTVGVCALQIAVMPGHSAASTVLFYSMHHETMAEVFPAGAFQTPDPYPPRQLPLI
jgi:hypothetical protein